MGLQAWAARCIPGFTILALVVLIALALTDIPNGYHAYFHSSASSSVAAFARESARKRVSDETTLPQVVFAAYNLFLHTLALFAPLRFCWALWHITNEVQQVGAKYGPKDSDLVPRSNARGERSSPGSPITDPGNYDEDEPGEGLDSLGRLRHAIVLPSYKEEFDNLRETLDVLAKHPQAKDTYDVSPCMIQSLP